MPLYLSTTFLKPTSANKTGRVKNQTKFQNINWQQVKADWRFAKLYSSVMDDLANLTQNILRSSFSLFIFSPICLPVLPRRKSGPRKNKTKISKLKKRAFQGQSLCLSLYRYTPIHCGLMKTWTFFCCVFCYLVLYFIWNFFYDCFTFLHNFAWLPY